MKGTKGTRIVRWDPDCRNVRPGPGIIFIILIIPFKPIINLIVIIFWWQERDFTNHNAKKLEHICSLTRSG